jgi:hypothetical protein
MSRRDEGVLAPASALLLARSTVPIIAIRTVFRRARRNGLFRIWAEELRGKMEKLQSVAGFGVKAEIGKWVKGEQAYLIAIARVAKFWVVDRPYTITIAAIDLS